MNKAQKAVEQAKLDAEKAVLDKLKKAYQQAAKDCAQQIEIQTGKINALLKDWDKLDDVQKSILQSQIYQRKYQILLKGQIDSFVETMNKSQHETLDQYMKDCYETGYCGSVYDLHSQKVPIISPIDQKQMLKAATINSKVSKKLYGKYVNQLKKDIQSEISRGITTGLSYADMARNIDSKANVGFNKAMRIARTEGHGVQIQAANDAQHAAKKLGADIVKQWDAALDARTRDSHRMVDGEIRELDEPFSNGMMFPSDPAGGAAEVINCRCALLQRARWALDDEELKTLQDRAAYYGLDKTQNFEEFKQKYLEGSKKCFKQPVGSSIIESEKIKAGTKQLQKALSSEDYDEFVEMLSNNPDVARLYANHLGDLKSVKKRSGGGSYTPSDKSVVFDLCTRDGLNKFGTLAHECGHYFDDVVNFNVNFKEIGKIHDKLGSFGEHIIRKCASNSDEFLAAVRADKAHLRKILTETAKKELAEDNASSGVQDAIDGLLGVRINWGHGDKYYNRKYSTFKSVKLEKALKEAYQELGFDVSSQAKVKAICRNYEAASEMWANIMDAVTNGGKTLEYVKKYLPNSYKALKEILKEVK